MVDKQVDKRLKLFRNMKIWKRDMLYIFFYFKENQFSGQYFLSNMWLSAYLYIIVVWATNQDIYYTFS